MIELLEDSVEQKKFLFEKIIKTEKDGRFSEHISPIDYSTCVPVDESFDYIKKGFKNSIQKFKFWIVMKKLMKETNKKYQFEFKGLENLKGIKTGAILTSNHFNKLDSMGPRLATFKATRKKIYTVSGDFNNYQGIVGDIARFTGLLPISDKQSVMKQFDKSLTYLLDKKQFVLVYPEQAMWWNYEKPRPLQNGAFHWAVKNNVPVVPILTTFRSNGVFDKDGYEDKFWTVNVLPPIYPDMSLNTKERIAKMKEVNYQAWKECFEKTYNKKLTYTCDSKKD